MPVAGHLPVDLILGVVAERHLQGHGPGPALEVQGHLAPPVLRPAAQILNICTEIWEARQKIPEEQHPLKREKEVSTFSFLLLNFFAYVNILGIGKKVCQEAGEKREGVARMKSVRRPVWTSSLPPSICLLGEMKLFF